MSAANAAALVPSPGGAGYVQVTLQTVAAIFGIVRAPAFRTAITMCVCSESRCVDGKLAWVTETSNIPLASAGLVGAEPPQADTTRHPSSTRPAACRGLANRSRYDRHGIHLRRLTGR